MTTPSPRTPRSSRNAAARGGRPRLRLGGPAEIVAAIPYLLGFHPHESMVVIGVRGVPSEVCVTLRADLPEPALAAAAASTAVASLGRSGAQAAVIAVVTGTGGPPGLPRADVIGHLRSALARRGIGVLDALCVRDGRWWSYTCTDPACCPAEGNAVPATGRASAIAASFAVQGTAVLADRAALEAVLDPEPDDGDALHVAFGAAERAQQELIRRQGAPAAVRAALTQVAAEVEHRGNGAGRLAPGAVAAFSVALALPGVRDACMYWIGGELAGAAEGLWLELVRRGVPPYAAAPAALLGLYAYARGDGAFAGLCADRALASDPGYVLAGLIQEALDFGIAPADITRIAAALVSGGEADVPPAAPAAWFSRGGGNA